MDDLLLRIQNIASQIFTKEDIWDGGNMEICFFYRNYSENTIIQFQKALWGYPRIFGPLEFQSKEPIVQSFQDPAKFIKQNEKYLNESNQKMEEHLYYVMVGDGIAELETDKYVPCSLNGYGNPGEILRIYFRFPMGGLASIFPIGGYPFGKTGDNHPWLENIDRWFKSLGEYIFQKKPFDIVAFGHECDIDEIERLMDGGEIPEQRFQGYLRPEKSVLRYYPLNEKSPYFTFD